MCSSDLILPVIGVETIYGQDVGNFRTLDALTTLAFDYPPRADFFRSELENFLLLAREQQFNLLAIRGSYAGALGIPQFMPSTYRNYAVDFNSNRKINLLDDDVDAIGSVANYLNKFGWVDRVAGHSPVSGKPADNKRHAVTIPPIAVPVQVSASFRDTDIAAPRTVSAWMLSGITPTMELARDQTARLIDFTMGGGDEKTSVTPPAAPPDGAISSVKLPLYSAQPNKQYWLVFNNFDVIRRYNNSDYYAMSVFQLAEALKDARKIH